MSATEKTPEQNKPKENDGVYNGAKTRLMQELKEFQKEKWVNVEVCLLPSSLRNDYIF